MSETSIEHKKTSQGRVNFALVTVSTSRYAQMQRGEAFSDVSAETASRLLAEAGHSVVEKLIVSDDIQMVRSAIRRLSENPIVEAIITIGGTGITSTDITIEAVSPLLSKELPGFGELFRNISYKQIGSAAILTRCIAATIRDKCIFCLPGSPQAVENAVRALIIPEVGHILAHARR
ncbi:MAG: molybdopterin-binding protein [Candidatus Bathyarchaeia archaeon]